MGGLLIWFVWIQAAPAASWLFHALGDQSAERGSEWARTMIDRAPQMRTLVMGMVLLLVLRFAPRGILPEALQRK